MNLNKVIFKKGDDIPASLHFFNFHKFDVEWGPPFDLELDFYDDNRGEESSFIVGRQFETREEATAFGEEVKAFIKKLNIDDFSVKYHVSGLEISRKSIAASSITYKQLLSGMWGLNLAKIANSEALVEWLQMYHVEFFENYITVETKTTTKISAKKDP